MNYRTETALRLAGLAALAMMTLGLGGCQLLAIWGQDEPIKAEYKLSKARLLVLVEEDLNAGGDPTVRYYMHDQLGKELTKHDINKQVVAEPTVREYLVAHPMSAKSSEAQLARELGAQQVLQVLMEPYGGNSEMIDPTNSGQLAAYVRVIDAESGDQAWPLHTKGHKVVFTLKVPQLHAAVVPTPELKMQLAKGLADQVAKLFYKHDPGEDEIMRREAGEHMPQ